MPTIDLKASPKAVKNCYAGLEEFHRVGVKHETAVRDAFQRLLEHCFQGTGWTLLEVDMMCFGLHSFLELGSKKIRA